MGDFKRRKRRVKVTDRQIAKREKSFERHLNEYQDLMFYFELTNEDHSYIEIIHFELLRIIKLRTKKIKQDYCV